MVILISHINNWLTKIIQNLFEKIKLLGNQSLMNDNS